MKIAFITDDGKTISQHFGRALYFLVVAFEDGQILNREMREKLGHQNFHNQHGDHKHDHGAHNGMTAHARNKHQQMAQTIKDCDAVICGGMGRGAYENMQLLGVKPWVTDHKEIEAALSAYLSGDMVNRTDMLH